MRHLLAALLLPSLLAGCASLSSVGNANCERRNFDEVSLEPGCSALCTQQPCAVYFRLPDNAGACEVTDGYFVLGKGRGGETLYLGAFWLGSHRIITTDAAGQQLPTAHLVVTGDPQD